MRLAADTRTFGGGVAITMGTNLAIMLLGLGTGIITARLLGAVGRGELASIQLWPALIVNVGVIGLPAAVNYYSGRIPASVGGSFTTAVALALLAASPLAVITYWALPYLLWSQSEATIKFGQVYLLFVPAGIMTGLSLASLQGQLKLLLWNILRLLAASLWFVVLIFLTMAESVSPQLVGISYLVLVFLLGGLYCAIVIANTKGPFAIRLGLAKRLFKYGVPSCLGSLPEQSSLRLDQLLIAAWLPPRILGLYIVAIGWTSTMTILSNAISYVVVPHVSRLRSTEEQGAALAKIVPGSLVISILLAAALAGTTPWGIHVLFGAEFEAAIPVIYVLILGGVISGMKGILSEGLRGLGRPKAVMVGELVGFVMSSLLLLLFLRAYGMLGAAVIVALGSGVTLVLLLISCSRSLRLPVSRLLVLDPEEWRHVLKKVRGCQTFQD